MKKAASFSIVASAILAVIILAVGCTQPAAKKEKREDLITGAITTTIKEGQTPEDWGHKKFADPYEAMKEAGISLTLPDADVSGRLICAYIGTNGMGQMGVAVWFEKLRIVCYRTGDSPINYSGWATSMEEMSKGGRPSALSTAPIAWATKVNGHEGMVWPRSENTTDKNQNGPVDLYWTDGSLSFELLGRDASITEAKAISIASGIIGK